jgi:hypothetical protein
MQTQTDLFNLAAMHLGQKKVAPGLTQRNRYFEQFELVEPFVRKQVLRAAHWPSARKVQRLALYRTRAGQTWADTDPAPGFEKDYQLPADCLHPRWLSDGRVFRLGVNGEQKTLATASADPILEYTFDQTNYSLWDNDLFVAISFALAAYAAYAVTGRANLTQKTEMQANEQITSARNLAANVDVQPMGAVASWHAARGYAEAPQSARYVFPHGPLLNVGYSANVQ